MRSIFLYFFPFVSMSRTFRLINKLITYALSGFNMNAEIDLFVLSFQETGNELVKGPYSNI